MQKKPLQMEIVALYRGPYKRYRYDNTYQAIILDKNGRLRLRDELFCILEEQEAEFSTTGAKEPTLFIKTNRLEDLRDAGLRTTADAVMWEILSKYARLGCTWQEVMEDRKKKGKQAEVSRITTKKRRENWASLPQPLQEMIIGIAKNGGIDVCSDCFHVSILCVSSVSQHEILERIKVNERAFCRWIRDEVTRNQTFKSQIRTLNPYRISRYVARKSEVYVTFVLKNAS